MCVQQVWEWLKLCLCPPPLHPHHLGQGCGQCGQRSNPSLFAEPSGWLGWRSTAPSVMTRVSAAPPAYVRPGETSTAKVRLMAARTLLSDTTKYDFSEEINPKQRSPFWNCPADSSDPPESQIHLRSWLQGPGWAPPAGLHTAWLPQKNPLHTSCR